MKSTLLSLTVLASLLSLSSAAGTLKLDIQGKREVGRPQLRKRAGTSGTVSTAMAEDPLFVSYYVNITIGTPPQPVTLVVDTGSSDVWAISTGAEICGQPAGCPKGTFDYQKSSTFNDNGPGEFQASYVDGSATTGDYFQDTFAIGGVSVDQFQMGLAANSSIPNGIMGIAFDTAEGGGTVQYPNLVDTMVNQSIIATQAYSLWLDDRAARTGSLLFGGVDTDKFEGTMSNIAMYPSSSGIVDRFTVAFTSFSITSPSGTDTLTSPGYAVPVVLDSGTTITYVPDDLALSIYNEVGATYSSELQEALCDCVTGTVQGTLNFGFAGANGVTIKVPISEMVSPLFRQDGTQETFTNGQPACLFGIGPSSSLGEDAPILFGDTMLRSAYVVYDLANFRIGLAQTNFNSSSSNVVAFASLSANIPSATTVTDESAVTQTASKGVGVAPDATGEVATGAVTAAVSTGLFTGNAGPGFKTAATATTKVAGATGTGSSKKGSAGRVEVRWEGMGLMGMVGVLVLGGAVLL